MIFDILILVVAAGACIMGFMKGILGQLGQLGGFIAGIVLARLFGSSLAEMFADQAGTPSAFESACGYTITFFIGYLGVWILVRALRAAVRALHLGIVDRLAGAAFSLLLWGLMLSLAVNLYALATNDVDLLDGDSKRPWRSITVRLAPVALGYLSRETLNNLSEKDVLNYVGHKSESTKNEQR